MTLSVYWINCDERVVPGKWWKWRRDIIKLSDDMKNVFRHWNGNSSVFFFSRRKKIFATLEMPVLFCPCLAFKNVFSAKNCLTTFFILLIFIEYVKRLFWKNTPLKMLNQITEMKIHYKCISFSACLVVLFWLIFMLKNDKKKRWLSFLRHVSHSMKLN